MTPYQVKRSVLFYSIQGKILPQIHAEGTGKTLLTENRKRIQNLTPNLQKKVGKGCKPIKEGEPPFEIPESWGWERFGNLVINYDSQRRPVTKSDRKTTKGLYDYYGATGAIDRVDEWIFDGEYLMIGEDGGNFFVDRDNSFIARGRFWANNHVHVVKPVVCDIAYLKICLDAYDLPNMGLINGIAVPKLNQENMNSILIPVPPLAEQKRIVARIEELMPLVDRYGQAWNRLEDLNKRFPGALQKSLLQLAIQGKLVEQRSEEGTGEELYQQIQREKQALIKAGKLKKEKPLPEITEDEKPFDIPESWKWVRIGKVFNLQAGKNKTGTDIYEECTSDHPYQCYGGNGCRGYVSDYNRTGQFVLIGRQGALCGNINYASGHFFATEHAVVVEQFANTNTRWCGLFLKALDLNQYATATAQPGLAVANINQLLIPLPPIAEQKRIVTKAEDLISLWNFLVY